MPTHVLANAISEFVLILSDTYMYYSQLSTLQKCKAENPILLLFDYT